MNQSLSYAAVPWSSGMGAPPTTRRYYTLVEWEQMHGPRRGMRGLGDMGDLGQGSTVQSIALSVPQIAGGVVAAGITSGSALGLGLSTAAIPVIGLAVAGVTLGLMALFSRKGPQQKVATTQIVNKVAPLWEQNLKAYQAGPHTYSSQQQALANFDAGWKYITDNCGRPEMGDPGKRCISERDRGGIYDGFAAWRDPIANDPTVKPDPVVDDVGNLIDTVTGGAFKSSEGGGSGLLLLAALAIGAAFLMGGSK